jgi:CubicO group peptidase (beta-lactamase class C family)
VREFFQDAIAEPMQVERYYMNPQPTGEPYLGGGWKFLPRDFMKFGQLFLDGGEWNGKRILSKQFAQRASLPLVTLRNVNIRSSTGKVMQYGYLLWTFEYPYRGRMVSAAFLSGLGGQVVMVIPELDMVIAGYGGNYGDRAGWTVILEYIPKFILPALEKPSL